MASLAVGAVATSLMVIVLICASGLTAFLLGGGRLPLAMTPWFVGGGLGGMALSTVVARKLSPVGLQKLFSVVIVLMALLILGRNLGLFSRS